MKERAIARGQIDLVALALKRQRGDAVRDRARLQTPTLPTYPDDPSDPVETQLAFFGSTLKYYRDGAWHVLAGGGGPRIVYGAIYNDGNILDAGSGDWTVAFAVNVYTITFDTAFPTPPIVLATPNCNNAVGGGADQGYFAVQTSRLAGSVVIKTYAQDGSADDGGFDFAAIGTA